MDLQTVARHLYGDRSSGSTTRLNPSNSTGFLTAFGPAVEEKPRGVKSHLRGHTC